MIDYNYFPFFPIIITFTNYYYTLDIILIVTDMIIFTATISLFSFNFTVQHRM